VICVKSAAYPQYSTPAVADVPVAVGTLIAVRVWTGTVAGVGTVPVAGVGTGTVAGVGTSAVGAEGMRTVGGMGMPWTIGMFLALFAVPPTEAPMTEMTEMATAIQRFVLQHVTSSVEAGDGGGGDCTGDNVCSAGLVSVCAGWIPGLYWPAEWLKGSGGPTADSGTAVTPLEYATGCV
jgi:hypothetical protein